MWPFTRKQKEIRLTTEEHTAVEDAWKLFMAAAPKGEGQGQWYAPKEVVDAMQKTIASGALLSLAERYLMQTRGSLAENKEEAELREKAAAAAMKAAAIDPDPLNLYKAGSILERVNRTDDAQTFFRAFASVAPEVLEKATGNYKVVVQNAIEDLQKKNF